MASNFHFGDNSYGKGGVKILYVNKNGNIHRPVELEVKVLLKLNSTKEYERGDNGDVIPTDTIKNLVYVVAKKFGIATVENFGINLCEWFLNNYPWVLQVTVAIQEKPWKRVNKDGKNHVHAFIHSPDGSRICEISKKRGEQPMVQSGLIDLTLLKTTQSGFVGFNKCQFTVLPETTDRIFSTTVKASWTYRNWKNLDFDTAWNKIKECIIDTFAGPPETGIYSDSVQETLHNAEKKALKLVPQIESIRLELPNVHYFNYDFSKYPHLPYQNDNTVFIPQDNPSGIINGELVQQLRSKL